MKSDFNRVRKIPVGTVCTSISDTFKGNAQQVVLVNTSDVLEGKVLNHQSVPNKNLRGQFKKTFCKEDILYSEIRPQNKRFAFVDFSPCNYIASTKLMVLRADQQQILPRYLYYFLTSNLIIAELQMLAETRSGTFPQITFSELANITIPVPLLDVQQSIVDIVKCIDDKIELNQKINENLERQAEAFFQSQFIGGKGTTGCLADICQYSKEKVAVSLLDLDSYYSTENMLPEKAGATQAANLPTTMQTTKCNAGDVLVSNIRPYFKKIIYCYADCGCSTDVLCFAPKKQELSAYLFFLLYADAFFDFMVAGSKGTKMPRGDKQQIMMYPVYVPSEEELAEFNSFAQLVLKQIWINREENKRLIALRDTLLPKLMAGEIDIFHPAI